MDVPFIVVRTKNNNHLSFKQGPFLFKYLEYIYIRNDTVSALEPVPFFGHNFCESVKISPESDLQSAAKDCDGLSRLLS